MQQTYTYLALGDSYTIGESVVMTESFPYQTVQLLREKGMNVSAPEIIAKTGWTTDELEEGIKAWQLLPKYDFATLLIGVNNQYRGRDAVLYKMEFEELLKKAISFAGKPSKVAVISIPDFTATPFAVNMNKEKVSKEIEVFNNINKAISIQYKVQYIDIVESSKQAAEDRTLVAEDGLHPSAKEYRKWAKKLANIFQSELG